MFSLAEQPGTGYSLFKLPAAQAQIEAFSGALLSQASGDPKGTHIALYNDAWLKGFCLHKKFLSVQPVMFQQDSVWHTQNNR